MKLFNLNLMMLFAVGSSLMGLSTQASELTSDIIAKAGSSFELRISGMKIIGNSITRQGEAGTMGSAAFSYENTDQGEDLVVRIDNLPAGDSTIWLYGDSSCALSKNASVLVGKVFQGSAEAAPAGLRPWNGQLRGRLVRS